MPHKKGKKKEQARKGELGKKLSSSHLGVKYKKAPLYLSFLTPACRPFLSQTVNSDESIRIIINWMLYEFLFGLFPPYLADSIVAFYEDRGRGGEDISLSLNPSNP